MNVGNIILKKLNEEKFTNEEINYFINSYVNKEIDDRDMTLLLKAICRSGMDYEETSIMTEAMLKSGDVIDLSDIEGIKIDKHSTGGVGDKTTLVLAPLVASVGVKVAKMSGRSLGFTGGTIDKLEAINMNMNLSLEDFKKQVNDIGVAISSQTGNLVPADKKIYALRDVTNTVESIPLIAASIMSKKLASGSDKIVLDVKVGNGALIKNIDDARTLANYMGEIGKHHGKEVVCVISNMEQPLGKAIGNLLEVKEAVATLLGRGPSDLVELVLTLGSIMTSSALGITEDEARKLLKTNLNNGTAYEKFLELIKAQNGRLDLANKAKIYPLKARKAGYVTEIDAYGLGEISRSIGAGRKEKTDIIDKYVGFVLNKKIGDYVEQGEELLRIYITDSDVKVNKILNCFTIKNEQVKPNPIIYDVISLA